MKDFYDYSLLAHNTFGIDVKCRRFVEYESLKEAIEVSRSLDETDFPLLILGGGSNLLLTGDYKSTVLHSAIKGIELVDGAPKGSQYIRCGSGEEWDDVVEYCISHNLYGAENLSIIPGEVGASAVQNIGAYGAEVKDLIVEVEAVEIATGSIFVFGNSDCQYSYRQSRFKREWKDKYLVTHVTYCLSCIFCPRLDYGNIKTALCADAERNGSVFDVSKVTARQVRDAIISIRNSKLPDPKVVGNGGSFFMNPIVEEDVFSSLISRFPGMPYYVVECVNEKKYKIPAGWMIDQCGWKGKILGKAGVHDKQALVLVNMGGAKGEDVVNLCRAIQRDVKEKFGVEILPEVNIR